MENYLEINKKTWNSKAAVHVNSDFYDNQSFINGKSTLNAIELELLGDVSEKSVLHLQCHFGQDTMTLARMGAKATGVDLSDKAIEIARELNQQLDLHSNFICCDVYETREHTQELFDMVFSSYGTIGWLPDLDKWAKVIADSLKPNGVFVFAEFHPMVWMFDNDFNEVYYSYFNVEEIVEDESGTYADRQSELENTSITWNHPLTEVLNALINSGLEIEVFNEYDYSPYNCFNHTEEFEPNKYRIQKLGNKIPMVYALRARKK